MFKQYLIALATGACLAMATPLAHAAKSTGETLDDSTVATSAKAILIDTKGVSSGSINIEVYKGVVQLGGWVDSQAEKDAALAAMSRVDGTRGVLDAMVISTGSRTAGQMLDDTTIQAKLKTALTNEQGMEKALAINTDVRRGEVLLSGWVADRKYKDKAGEIAQGISGVTRVHNLIAIKP